MDEEEGLYGIVAEEIERGEVRTGLWAKALAEERYDKQRAKARYMRLRLRSLREELRAEQARKRNVERVQEEQQLQIQIRELDSKGASLEHFRRQRSLIHTSVFAATACFGTLVSYLHIQISENSVGNFIASVFLGALIGSIGLLFCELFMLLSPRQRRLRREERAISVAREGLKLAQKSKLTAYLEIAVCVLVIAAFVAWNYYERTHK